MSPMSVRLISSSSMKTGMAIEKFFRTR